MKRLILIFMVSLLWGCSASVVEVDEPLVDNQQPVLVLTYVEGLESSLERFLNRPLRSFDRSMALTF
jgi:hypothetical protein